MQFLKLLWTMFLIILIFEIGVQVGKWDGMYKNTFHKEIVRKVTNLIKG